MIKNWLRNFMIGRYGQDHLNNALLIAALAAWLLSLITGSSLLRLLYYIFMFLAIFRMFSRQIEKRRKENDRFLTYWWPMRRKLQLFIRKTKERRTHKFFKCPGCRNTLRVPKGKGKVNITCPKCGERFQKKT